MTITDIMQKKLDELLLPDGVLSHHIRRVKVDTIKGSTVPVNNDEYVVYRLVSSRDGAYGDGNAQLTRQYVDVNYYYTYDKTDARYKDAERHIMMVSKKPSKPTRVLDLRTVSTIYPKPTTHIAGSVSSFCISG